MEKYSYDKAPWDFCPELTKDCIFAIAEVIQRKTRECQQERLDFLKGDSHYSYGHVARAWRIAGLKQLIFSGKYPSLRLIKEKGNGFEFACGTVGLRFYSSSPEEMTSSMMKLSPYECGQYSLKLEGQEGEELYWRILIDAAPISHDLLSVSFVGFNNHNEVVCNYLVPLEQVPIIYDVDKTVKEVKKISDAPFQKKNTTNMSEVI